MLPRTPAALVGSHQRQVNPEGSSTDVPAGLDPARLRKGALRLLAFAAFVVALILAVPGLSSNRAGAPAGRSLRTQSRSSLPTHPIVTGSAPDLWPSGERRGDLPRSRNGR